MNRYPWCSIRSGAVTCVIGILAGLSAYASVRMAGASPRGTAVWVAVIGIAAALSFRIAQRQGWVRRHRLTEEDVEGLRARLSAAVIEEWRGWESILGTKSRCPLMVRWSSASDSPGISDGEAPDVLALQYLGTRHRQLVITGESDSGKSVLAVRLVRELQSHRSEELGGRVPVLFMLESWRPNERDLRGWLISQLRREFGIGRRDAQLLVDEDHLIPVLDGFNEVPDVQRENGAFQIERRFGEDQPTILTSQIEPLRKALMKLGPLGAAELIELKPLAVEMIIEFLDAESASEWGEVRARLKEDPNGGLAEALSSPLMASLALTGYSLADSDPSELLRFSDKTGIRSHLLQKFVPAEYRSGRYGREGAERALQLLASWPEHRNTAQVSWWRILEEVPSGTQLLFRALVGLVAALGSATYLLSAMGWNIAVAASSDAMMRLSAVGLMASIGFGVLVAYIVLPSNWIRRLSPVPRQLAMSSLRGMVRLTGEVALVSIVSGPVFAVLFSQAFDLKISWAEMFIGGLNASLYLFFPIMAFAIIVDQAKSIDTPASAGARESLELDRRGFLVRFVLTDLIATALLSLRIGFTPVSVVVGLVLSLSLLKTSSWWGYVLATSYFAAKGLLPRDLVAFLDDACARGVLRKAGASYQFRHRVLQRHLADAHDRRKEWDGIG